MKNEVIQTLDLIREMSIQKMITLKFITKEKVDQYIKENKKGSKC